MRTMGGADQVMAREVEKIAFLPIQRYRHMRTLVEIAVHDTVVAHDEPTHIRAMFRQREIDAASAIHQLRTSTDQAFSFSHAWSLAKLSKQASGAC